MKWTSLGGVVDCLELMKNIWFSYMIGPVVGSPSQFFVVEERPPEFDLPRSNRVYVQVRFLVSFSSTNVESTSLMSTERSGVITLY